MMHHITFVQWMKIYTDPSRLCIYIVTLLTIVYSCFYSLYLQRECEKLRKKDNKTQTANESGSEKICKAQTVNPNGYLAEIFAYIPTTRFADLPWIITWIILITCPPIMVLSLYCKSLHVFLDGCYLIAATFALAFSLFPMCLYMYRQFPEGDRLLCKGRFSVVDLSSFLLALFLVCMWILTEHWIFLNAFGIGVCVVFIVLVRIPNLKIFMALLGMAIFVAIYFSACLLYFLGDQLSGNSNGIRADLPVGHKSNVGTYVGDISMLIIVVLMKFPSIIYSGHYSIISPIDIYVPGLLICFALRFDAHKEKESIVVDASKAVPRGVSKLIYFPCLLLGYFLGLLTWVAASVVFTARQPSIIYSMPFTLLPLLTLAYLKGDLKRMWSGPFDENIILEQKEDSTATPLIKDPEISTSVQLEEEKGIPTSPTIMIGEQSQDVVGSN